ncbi:unnamed protein product [Polarella glacialis]|uniref:C3H1-type domain-containing protein n=1 Tax=Polarella glacialis TaxID=89957 RepID=A0A813I925_POLGL|nr:unnamed protein product [Polarella glacialis]CAE8720624.1 unnamed protein product [Polarella glacialis]
MLAAVEEVSQVFAGLKQALEDAEEAMKTLARTEKTKLNEALQEVSQQREEEDERQKEFERLSEQKEFEFQERWAKQEEKINTKREQSHKLVKSLKPLQAQIAQLRTELAEARTLNASLENKMGAEKLADPIQDAPAKPRRTGSQSQESQSPCPAARRSASKPKRQSCSRSRSPQRRGIRLHGPGDSQDSRARDQDRGDQEQRDRCREPPSSRRGTGERTRAARDDSREPQRSGSRSAEPQRRRGGGGKGKDKDARGAQAILCSFVVVGKCTRGDRCPLRHPPAHEVELIHGKMGRTPCRFGLDCTRAGCLCKHPEGKRALREPSRERRSRS